MLVALLCESSSIMALTDEVIETILDMVIGLLPPFPNAEELLSKYSIIPTNLYTWLVI